MNSRQAIIIITISLIIQACDQQPDLPPDATKTQPQSHIKNVMNLKMDFDESKTVGDALNSWSECKERKWSEFKNAKKQPVVQFICSSTNIEEFIQQTISVLDKPDSFMANTIHGEQFQIKSVITKFQWTEIQPGKYEITDAHNVWTWKNDKSQKNNNDAIPLLQAIYDNQITFDLALYKDPKSLIASQTAVGYAQMFGKLYSLAK